jgi:isoamylase
MVWHGYLPEVRPGQLYGYRVLARTLPSKAIDSIITNFCSIPTASKSGNHRWSDSHFGYRVGHKQEDLSFDRRDDAAGMPKNRVIDSAFTWGADAPPKFPGTRP